MHYYAREGYPQHVQSVCNELIKHGSSPVLQFWRAYGLLASGPATAEVRGGNSNCSLCRVPLLLMLLCDTLHLHRPSGSCTAYSSTLTWAWQRLQRS